jgi:hypothetical protein
LLTESMICSFFSSELLLGSSSGTAGYSAKTVTQLELLEYHDKSATRTNSVRVGARVNQLLHGYDYHQQ